jgi:predicted kinase
LSRVLAVHLGALHLRIDSIEQAIIASSIALSSVEEAGYLAGYAVAEDNLRLGRTVVADSVNSLPLTRNAWGAVAERAGVDAFEVGTICSDTSVHRRRIETRVSDIHGLLLPTWDSVMAREYNTWHSQHLVVDTAVDTIEQSRAKICAALEHVL